jgi:hypothetical protein
MAQISSEPLKYIFLRMMQEKFTKNVKKYAIAKILLLLYKFSYEY